MRRLLLPACLLLMACGPVVRAGAPVPLPGPGSGPDCCSNYPVYLCQPGYLGYPMPPRDLTTFGYNGSAGGYANGGCGNGCGHANGGCHDNGNGEFESETACGQITPNSYSCCFYGVTLSNYALITPVSAILHGAPSRLPAMPPAVPGAEKIPAPGEKLPAPAPR